jgi:hypothetical protein
MDICSLVVWGLWWGKNHILMMGDMLRDGFMECQGKRNLLYLLLLFLLNQHFDMSGI